MHGRAQVPSRAAQLAGSTRAHAPIAHWSFDQDDGSTALDVTGNGHTLKLEGIDFEEQGWQDRGAISIDGNSSAEAASAPALKLGEEGGDFSIAFAMFLRESASTIQTLVKKGAANSGSPSLKLQANDNRIRYRVRTETGQQEATSESEITVDQWVHIAYVKPGQSLKLFIDGQFDSEKNLQGESVSSNGPLFMGNEPQGNGVNALFHSIQMFDWVLSADAVIALTGIDNFPANKSLIATPRVIFYPFDHIAP